MKYTKIRFTIPNQMVRAHIFSQDDIREKIIASLPGWYYVEDYRDATADDIANLIKTDNDVVKVDGELAFYEEL